MVGDTATDVRGPDNLDAAVRAAVRAELDEILPHVVTALKRNDAVAALTSRLDRAEKLLAERGQRSLVSGLRAVLTTVRRLEFEAEFKDVIVDELERVLGGAGYTEFGDAGQPFDADRHEAIAGTAEDGRALVVEVFEPGLETLGMIVAKAKVRVAPSTRTVESDIKGVA